MCRVSLHMSLVFSFKPGIAATMLDLNHAMHGNYSPMRYSITWYYIEKQTKNQVLHKKHKISLLQHSGTNIKNVGNRAYR